jgi:iron complex outermembrane receptor protein
MRLHSAHLNGLFHACRVSIGSCSILLLGVGLAQAVDAPPNGTPPIASTTTTEQTQLELVVVTGSLIPQSQSYSAGPMTVITSQDLQQSGYTDVSDILRNLPSNGMGTLTQANPNAVAGGASGVSLRGLTVGATLTLIDGHRMVAYPLYDDGQRSFVDLSDIPFNAIERIEVLKDGASSEYGSDAIAGVVNIILKKSFTGTEVTAEAGTSQKNDGTLEHFAGISGAGDLDREGYNAYISVDFHHQDKILVSNRSGLYTTLNWIPYGGINDTAGAAITSYAPYPPSITGYLFNPNTSTGTPFAYLPGCSATAQAANQCTFPLKGLQIQPPTENLNVLGKFTKSLGDQWRTSLTASVFESEAEQVGGYSSTGSPYGLLGIGLEPGQAPILVGPQVITVPQNYPGNPFGIAAPLVYTFHELGNKAGVYDTNTYRFVADVCEDDTKVVWLSRAPRVTERVEQRLHCWPESKP